MDIHDKETPNIRHRRKGLEEEQVLCEEALKSGDYDLITDAAWVRLCEEAVSRGRASSRSSGA